jgi:hypothetical protein
VFSKVKIPANMPAPPAASPPFPTPSVPFWIAVDGGVETIFDMQALHSSLGFLKACATLAENLRKTHYYIPRMQK